MFRVSPSYLVSFCNLSSHPLPKAQKSQNSGWKSATAMRLLVMSDFRVPSAPKTLTYDHRSSRNQDSLERKRTVDRTPFAPFLVDFPFASLTVSALAFPPHPSTSARPDKRLSIFSSASRRDSYGFEFGNTEK